METKKDKTRDQIKVKYFLKTQGPTESSCLKEGFSTGMPRETRVCATRIFETCNN